MKRNLLLTLVLMLLGGVNLYAAPANGVEDIPGGKKYTLTNASSDEEKRAAFKDKDAVIIDVTGVTDIDPTLTSANPNCIIIANAGTLATSQNVCVNGVIASLVLEDMLEDRYPFACPAGVKATVAQYSRRQPNAFGTICLPFDVSDTDVEYYTTNGVRSSDGALLLSKLTTLPAGTPAIVYNYNHEKSPYYMLNNKAGSELAAAADHSDGNGVKMVGSFVDKTINVTQGDNYYGISNNQFVKVTETLNVKPFRAYLTSTTPLAKLRLQIDDEETLAIQTLTSEGNAVSAIYNANGVRQQGLQKGLNIVKMQNGQNMKVYVK